MTIHSDDYAAHIATEADATHERFAGSHAELPTWSDWDELTEEEREAQGKKERNQEAWNVIGKLILRSKGLDDSFNLGDEIHSNID